MRILSLEASANTVSVAVVESDKLIGEYTINHKKTHSQTLMPMIEELLKNCEIDAESIDLVAVSKGPGSFTGLRIGVETAKALAHGLKKPIAGVDTTYAMAHNLLAADPNKLIVPIMDARRNQVYTGIYKTSGTEIETVFETAAMGIDELATKIKETNKNAIFLGDGVAVHSGFLKETLGSLAEFAPINNSMQRASSVALAAKDAYKNKEFDTYLSLVPEYLRKSQAEREYDERNK